MDTKSTQFYQVNGLTGEYRFGGSLLYCGDMKKGDNKEVSVFAMAARTTYTGDDGRIVFIHVDDKGNSELIPLGELWLPVIGQRGLKACAMGVIGDNLYVYCYNKNRQSMNLVKVPWRNPSGMDIGPNISGTGTGYASAWNSTVVNIDDQ
ncbi:hypothetical protein [Streptomyces chartreusis]|uniref:hypothetical protein n=1 Tax=Streptomyces chartreusis TaxID=1969 RepID=UPI002E192C06